MLHRLMADERATRALVRRTSLPNRLTKSWGSGMPYRAFPVARSFSVNHCIKLMCRRDSTGGCGRRHMPLGMFDVNNVISSERRTTSSISWRKSWLRVCFVAVSNPRFVYSMASVVSDHDLSLPSTGSVELCCILQNHHELSSVP